MKGLNYFKIFLSAFLIASQIVFIPQTLRAEMAMECRNVRLEAMAMVKTEFDILLTEIGWRDRFVIKRHKKSLIQESINESMKILETACGGVGCAASEIRNILFEVANRKLGRTLKLLSSDQGEEAQRLKIAARMFIVATVVTSVVSAAISFTLTGGSISISEIGHDVRRNLTYVVSSSVSSMLGGGILTYLISSKTEALAYRSMERAARKKGKVDEALGEVDPKYLEELVKAESNINPIAGRVVGGSRRFTETLSSYFPAFKVGAELALGSRDEVNARIGYLSMAKVILTILKTRFETNSETNVVQESFSTALWAFIPKENLSKDSLEASYNELVDAIREVHLNELGQEAPQKFMEGDVKSFLDKLYYPRFLSGMIAKLTDGKPISIKSMDPNNSEVNLVNQMDSLREEFSNKSIDQIVNSNTSGGNIRQFVR